MIRVVKFLLAGVMLIPLLALIATTSPVLWWLGRPTPRREEPLGYDPDEDPDEDPGEDPDEGN